MIKKIYQPSKTEVYFKFQQNHTLNEEFDFWRGEGGQGDHHSKILISIIISKHMKMLFQISTKSHRK